MFINEFICNMFIKGAVKYFPICSAVKCLSTHLVVNWRWRKLHNVLQWVQLQKDRSCVQLQTVINVFNFRLFINVFRSINMLINKFSYRLFINVFSYTLSQIWSELRTFVLDTSNSNRLFSISAAGTFISLVGCKFPGSWLAVRFLQTTLRLFEI